MLSESLSLQFNEAKGLNKVKRIIDSIYKSYWGRWIWSFIISVVIFVITDQMCQKVFYTNDDENIMYTLAGYYTNGIPQDHSFVNAILAYFLGFLYTIFPTLPWYGLFHLIVLGATTVVLFKVTLEYGQKKDMSFWACNIIAFLGYIGIVMYPSIVLQFTSTSACAGGAALLLLLSINFKNDRKIIIFEEVLSGIFVLLCYMHRKNSGTVLFCFYFCTLFYQWLRVFMNSKKHAFLKKYVKDFIIYTIVIIGAIVLVTMGSNLLRASDEWDYYYDFEDARYKMTDYAHDSYYDNPELYDSIGWSRELYELGGTYWWFFMDENINEEAFKKISNTGYYNVEFDLETTIAECIALFKDNPITSFYLCQVIIFILIYVVLLFFKKRTTLTVVELLYYVCMTGGALLLCLYLCIMGRFIQRAFHAIAIPYLCIAYVLFVKNLCGVKITKKTIVRVLACIMIAVNCLWFPPVWNALSVEVASRIEKSSHTIAIEQYAMNNPDNFYVYDISLTFRYLPFVEYQDQYPSNLSLWGGIGWNSPAFFKQLELNGLEDLYSENLFEPNVYYICKVDYLGGGRPMVEKMCEYMVVEYPGCRIELVDTVQGNICVYKFHRN